MLAHLFSFALLIGYASAAQCRSKSASSSSSPATPLDVCYPESYDGTDYVYTKYKCEGTVGAYTAYKYTYSDAACTVDETIDYEYYYSSTCSETSTSSPCFCNAAKYDICEYATYVTWDTCNFQRTYSNGNAVVINECVPYPALSSYSLMHQCYSSALPYAYPGSYDVTIYSNDACAPTVAPTPYPTTPTTPYPTSTPYPTYPTTSPTTPYPTSVTYSCTKFTGGCSNYGAASRVFAAAAFVVAALAYLLQ